MKGSVSLWWGGDNERALVEGKAYVSFAQGSLGKSVCGKAAVVDQHGQIIGVVSVGYLIERLQDRVDPSPVFLGHGSPRRPIGLFMEHHFGDFMLYVDISNCWREGLLTMGCLN